MQWDEYQSLIPVLSEFGNSIFVDTVMMGHTDGEWALHLI